MESDNAWLQTQQSKVSILVFSVVLYFVLNDIDDNNYLLFCKHIYVLIIHTYCYEIMMYYYWLVKCTIKMLPLRGGSSGSPFGDPCRPHK